MKNAPKGSKRYVLPPAPRPATLWDVAVVRVEKKKGGGK